MADVYMVPAVVAAHTYPLLIKTTLCYVTVFYEHRLSLKVSTPPPTLITAEFDHTSGNIVSVMSVPSKVSRGGVA